MVTNPMPRAGYCRDRPVVHELLMAYTPDAGPPDKNPPWVLCTCDEVLKAPTHWALEADMLAHGITHVPDGRGGNRPVGLKFGPGQAEAADPSVDSTLHADSSPAVYARLDQDMRRDAKNSRARASRFRERQRRQSLGEVLPGPKPRGA